MSSTVLERFGQIAQRIRGGRIFGRVWDARKVDVKFLQRRRRTSEEPPELPQQYRGDRRVYPLDVACSVEQISNQVHVAIYFHRRTGGVDP